MRVLFVEEGSDLKNQLDPMLRARDGWTAEFAGSAAEAAMAIERAQCDVVVAHVAQNSATGADALRTVEKALPLCIRVVLSENRGDKNAIASLPVAHRLVGKPFIAAELFRTIEQAFALRSRMRDPRVTQAIADFGKLPPIPEIYLQVEKALREEKPLAEVGSIIARDPAMSSRILQIVNSAWFATRRRIEAVSQAVSFLGAQQTKSLVMSIGTASLMNKLAPRAKCAISVIGEHVGEVAVLAQDVAKRVGLPRDRQDECFSAAVLHDVGRLVIATRVADGVLPSGHDARLDAERERFGVTHAELGACLLELWGVPEATVDAACRHEDRGMDEDLIETTLIVRLANLVIGAKTSPELSEELAEIQPALASRGWFSRLKEVLPPAPVAGA